MNNKSPTDRKPSNSLKRILVFMLWTYIATLAALIVLEPRMLFPAPNPSQGDWEPAKFDATDVWVQGGDNSQIHVWTFKHITPRATIVFSHGNGEDLGSLGGELLELSRKLSVNVVAYDFRGYGKTGGKANQANILADAATVGKWVRDQPAWSNVPVIPMGRSLGGAAAIEMATELQAPGIILDRTFSSAVDVAASIYPVFPVRLLMKNHFPSEEKIKLYSGRVLQFHGDVDSIVPIQFGRKLYDACPADNKEFVEVPGLEHNDLHSQTFWEKASAFIEELSLAP
ncbi:MAG: alpha/beta hydrolase [Pirellula sp.]